MVALATTYVLGGKLGLQFALVHASATPLWPPTGIALAALLVGGYRLWPGFARYLQQAWDLESVIQVPRRALALAAGRLATSSSSEPRAQHPAS